MTGWLTLRISKDGDQWCALVGEDLQAGCGCFGDRPEQAVERLIMELAAQRLQAWEIRTPPPLPPARAEAAFTLEEVVEFAIHRYGGKDAASE